MSDAEFLLVPLFGEFIAIEDLAVTTVDLDWGTALDVYRHVILFSSQ